MAILVVLSVAGAAVRRSSSRDGRGTALSSTTSSLVGAAVSAAELPPPETSPARETQAWLSTEGRPLIEMVEAAKELLGQPLVVESCRATTQRLERAAPAGRMLELTAGVADEPLRGLLQSERSSLLAVVSDCLAGRSTGGKDSELRERTALTQRRLEEVRDAAR